MKSLLELTQFATLLLLVTVGASSVANPLAQGVIDGAGGGVGTIGTIAARTNRQVAEGLGRQSIDNFNSGIRTLNIPLLIKAGTQAYESMKADDQAKENGRAALSALNTGNNAGQMNLERFGTDLSTLQDHANNSHKYMSTISATAARFGVRRSADGRTIQTPLGDVPTNWDTPEITRNVLEQLNRFGLPTAGVEEAIQSAMRSRDELAARAQAEAQQALARAQALGADPSAAGAAGVAPTDSEPALNAIAGDEAPRSAVAPVVALDRVPNTENLPLAGTNDIDAERLELMKQQEAFLKTREAMKEKLGLNNDQDKNGPIGRPDQDIFQMVHTRYQILKRQDTFLSGDLDVASFQRPN